MAINIRNYQESDWPMVSQIYREGIESGMATFETVPKNQTEFESQVIRNTSLVAECSDQVAAWAALWPVSDRCCYSGVAEVSVYVATAARGQGVGRTILTALTERSERLGIWTLQSGVMAVNKASIALHEKCGYRVVGRRERLGSLNGVWHDVILLERRSRVVGC